MRRFRALLGLLATVVAVLALGTGAASAHVTVGSTDAAPGGFGELTFRVPSESDTAATVGLKVQLPTETPLAFVSVKPVPGWTATTTTAPVDPPITDDDGNQITEAVSGITWTADPGAGIKPGQYQSFSISAGPLPGAASLSLPAVQSYDDGTQVAWIEPRVEGQAEPEHPAPVLTLADESPAQPAADAAPVQNDSTGVAVTALVLAIGGLLAGLAGLFLGLSARRRSRAPEAGAAGDAETEREPAARG